jgi:myosin heavy subunit
MAAVNSNWRLMQVLELTNQMATMFVAMEDMQKKIEKLETKNKALESKTSGGSDRNLEIAQMQQELLEMRKQGASDVKVREVERKKLKGIENSLTGLQKAIQECKQVEKGMKEMIKKVQDLQKEVKDVDEKQEKRAAVTLQAIQGVQAEVRAQPRVQTSADKQMAAAKEESKQLQNAMSVAKRRLMVFNLPEQNGPLADAKALVSRIKTGKWSEQIQTALRTPGGDIHRPLLIEVTSDTLQGIIISELQAVIKESDEDSDIKKVYVRKDIPHHIRSQRRTQANRGNRYAQSGRRWGNGDQYRGSRWTAVGRQQQWQNSASHYGANSHY